MKKYFYIVILLFISNYSIAQKNANALSLSFGGGQNSLMYETSNGVTNEVFGWNVSAEFHHYFSSRFGISTGIELQTYSSSNILNFTEETQGLDAEGNSYLFKTKFNNWIEQQQLINFEIPVTLFYQFSLSEKFQLQTAIGAKLCLPVSSQYKTIGGEMATSAFYPLWNVELYDLPQYGYDTFTNEFKGNYQTTIGYIGVAEIGGLYKLTDKINLFGKFYYNYGFNNILESVNQNIYSVSGVYNGILNSNQTEVVKLKALGLRIGLSMNL